LLTKTAICHFVFGRNIINKQIRVIFKKEKQDIAMLIFAFHNYDCDISKRIIVVLILNVLDKNSVIIVDFIKISFYD
jgi:hypothetical protein